MRAFDGILDFAEIALRLVHERLLEVGLSLDLTLLAVLEVVDESSLKWNESIGNFLLDKNERAIILEMLVGHRTIIDFVLRSKDYENC